MHEEDGDSKTEEPAAENARDTGCDVSRTTSEFQDTEQKREMR